MNPIHHIWPAAVFVTAIALLSGGCNISTDLQREIKVSPATASVLKKIDARLSAADAEVGFRCGTTWTGATTCTVRIDGTRGTDVNAVMINHPFEGTPMVFRITGGSDALRTALYGALGEFTQTTEFNAELYEREILLEGEKFKIRCTATRQGAPESQCWTLISADLLD